ncbi:MAG TPA: 3-oxo-tetronate kinase [Candidatus Limnocylindrales bacterium]|nr:3-oxo-tetronate kinase [Candidatus Limnocylindrales bacterium]
MTTRQPPGATRGPAIGIVADDLTGAGDVAGVLARAGVRTALIVGVPDTGRPLPDAEAVVVGLRIRSLPAPDAVRLASTAARRLATSGVAVLGWKVCSTFDSTPAGNIGPVSDALLAITGLPAALVCPAYPANGRTVEGGQLLVHGVPLDRTSMRDHPLTPMRDADVVRLLAPQVEEPGRVARLRAAAIDAGAAIDRAVAAGARYLVADAGTTEDAEALGAAVIGRALPVMAAGLAPGIVEGLRRAGRLPPASVAPAPARLPGRTLVLAGSCSEATLGQVREFGRHGPVLRLEPAAPDCVARAVAAVRRSFAAGNASVLLASSDDPAGVVRTRGALGGDAGAVIERALGEVADALARDGVRRVVVAGGETTGAVLEGLGVRELRVGPEVAPGVPLLERVDGQRMLLVAKSGNFGGPDLFARAIEAMDGEPTPPPR